MLGSLFLTLAVSAVVPLVVASVVLPPAGRHAHVAVSGASTRRVRLAAAAAGLALCGLGTAALLGAGPVAAMVVAVVLAGSMLAWSGLDGGSWAVRGVVVWALAVTVAAGLLGWVGHRVLDSTSAVGTAVGGVAWVVLLLSMTRLGRYFRERIGERARREVSDAAERQPRPLAAALALLAASGVAVAVIAVPADSPSAQAGRGGPGDEAGLSKTGAAEGSTGPDVSTGTGSATPTPAPGRTASRRGERPAASGQTADRSGSTSTAPTPSSPSPTGPPAQDPTDPDKTPGYLKDKPNRPDKAPSPGSGNPHGR